MSAVVVSRFGDHHGLRGARLEGEACARMQPALLTCGKKRKAEGAACVKSHDEGIFVWYRMYPVVGKKTPNIHLYHVHKKYDQPSALGKGGTSAAL